MGGEAVQRWINHQVGDAEAGHTVRDVLRGPMALSGRMIQRLTRGRGILLNRRPAFLDRRVRSGDVVAARLATEEAPALAPVPMPLRVILEDADLIVVDKPAGLLVHPTSASHRRTLAHGIAHHLLAQGVREKVRPVHRIDRDTSGLVLFARSAHAHAALDAQLRDRRLRRSYLAVLHGVPVPAEGVIDAPIGRHPVNPTLRAVRAGGEPARTRYRVAERCTAASCVEIELETGRTHQIRVHAAHLGHPVLGDRWYGAPAGSGLGRPALHAHHLTFRHPRSGELVAAEAPVPDDIATLMDRLRSRQETDRI